MFTGIVSGVGLVTKLKNFKTHLRLWVRTPFSLKGTRLGDSIAVEGCCLTVTGKQGRVFSADLSPETLLCTNLGELKKGSRVNLEKPLRLGDPVGGHLVQGHVDGIGVLSSSRLVKTGPVSYYLTKVRLPKKLMKYVIPKGSIAVDGISLTVNELKKNEIDLCIIPHTQAKTTLTGKKPGARLNIELDMMLKFMEKMLKSSQGTGRPALKRKAKK